MLTLGAAREPDPLPILQPNAPWGCELFHAGRQVRGLADGGVVHAQIVADGPHHHLAGKEQREYTKNMAAWQEKLHRSAGPLAWGRSRSSRTHPNLRLHRGKGARAGSNPHSGKRSSGHFPMSAFQTGFDH
jgi:hypothetical protein